MGSTNELMQESAICFRVDRKNPHGFVFFNYLVIAMLVFYVSTFLFIHNYAWGKNMWFLNNLHKGWKVLKEQCTQNLKFWFWGGNYHYLLTIMMFPTCMALFVEKTQKKRLIKEYPGRSFPYNERERERNTINHMTCAIYFTFS